MDVVPRNMKCYSNLVKTKEELKEARNMEELVETERMGIMSNLNRIKRLI